MIIETERLSLRYMTQADLQTLHAILQDKDVMYAYEGPFSEDEVLAWFDRQIERYKSGIGLWAVVLKETGDMIGQCGLTMQDYNGGQVLEIGYLFLKEYWYHGYATEAAIACREYAFIELDAEEVFSIIRTTNTPSIRVAKRTGMTCAGSFVKHYRGVDMPHLLYRVRRCEKVEIGYLADHPEHIQACASWAYGLWACQSNTPYNLVLGKFKKGVNKRVLPITFVACDDLKPAGMVSLWKSDAGRGDLSPWLACLYVHPSHRGKKISFALIDRCLEEAQRLGFREIYLVTEEAKALYEKFGWIETEQTRTPYGDASLMRKPIKQP